MAMTMIGEYQLPVAREIVWVKLNDTETLKACIPGCKVVRQIVGYGISGCRRDQDSGRLRRSSKARSRSQTLIHRTVTKFPVRVMAAWQASPPVGRR